MKQVAPGADPPQLGDGYDYWFDSEYARAFNTFRDAGDAPRAAAEAERVRLADGQPRVRALTLATQKALP